MSRRLVKWVRELAVSPGLILTPHLQLLPEVNNAWSHTSDLPLHSSFYVVLNYRDRGKYSEKKMVMINELLSHILTELFEELELAATCDRDT